MINNKHFIIGYVELDLPSKSSEFKINNLK